MSFHVFFGFSQGLARPLQVPAGTLASYHQRLLEVEQALKLERDGNHWNQWKMEYEGVPNELLCETVENHNNWVQQVYRNFGKWAAEPVLDGDTITVADADNFWFGLTLLNVPPSRWTADYYEARMSALYEVMRGRETDGMSFDVKALTPKQGAAVINLFAQYLDHHDRNLDVPNGRDHLASSSNGGYEWCEKCGPMDDEAIHACRKRKCPIEKW